MPSHKLTAIILKRTNLGEADRIVTAFSKELGKIKFVAKGVRRTKSKLAGSIEPYCLVNLMVSDGKSLDILTSAEIKNNYLGLSPDLEKLKLAGFVAEVVNKLTPDNLQNIQLYCLINEVLSQITLSPTIIKIYFLVKYFDISGILPETRSCVKCAGVLQEDCCFSLEAGGLVDNDCSKYFEDSQRIRTNAVKTIRIANQVSLNDFKRLKIPDIAIQEANGILKEYLRYTSDKTFKSELI